MTTPEPEFRTDRQALAARLGMILPAHCLLVDDEDLRMLVCRLCAAAITADGRVSREERMLYNHALARWRINSQQVSEAIRQDPMH